MSKLERSSFSIYFFCLISVLFTQDVISQVFLQKNLNFANPADLILKTNSGTNGISIADYNQDGYLDIYFVVKEEASKADFSTRNRLFLFDGEKYVDKTSTFNDGVSGFTEVIQTPYGYKIGASWGDYNNDGFPDLFLANSGKDILLKNTGNGQFINITQAAGVAGKDSVQSSQGLWFDYDKDGDLDLYVSVRQDWSPSNRSHANRMYENSGNDTFIDVSEESGLNDAGLTFTTLPLDVDNDGDLDLYLANDFGLNKLYINNGDKTFTEQTDAFGLSDQGEGMGLSIGDPDNNGLFDIYLTNVTDNGESPLRFNRLFVNTEQNFFEKKEFAKGVSEAGWGWGSEFFDFDNDGDEDLLIANGYQTQVEPDINRLFRNTSSETDTLSFERFETDAGISANSVSYTNAVFDQNNDGFLDFVTSNFFQKPVLYENTLDQGNWLKIWLEGVETNRNGFGSVLRLYTGEDTFSRYYHGAGLYTQHILPIHFGLENATIIDSLQVKWLSGKIDRFYNLEPNQTLNILEGGLITSNETDYKREFPTQLILLGNYPNPFNNSTVIQFQISQPDAITLEIFSISGQKILTHSTSYSTGTHSYNWETGNLNSGAYVYRIITSSGENEYGKMLFIK